MSRDNPIPTPLGRSTCAQVLARRHLAHHFGDQGPDPDGPLAPARVVTARQVHGRAVVVVDGARPAAQVAATPADALVARGPHVAVGVWTADCVPLLAGDLAQPVVGAAHAGWRGVVGGVVAAWVAALAALGAPARRLCVALGPAIGPCCFRIGEDVAAALGAAWAMAPGCASPAGEGPPARGADGIWRADLWALCRRQLLAAGVAPARIEALRRCTACSPNLHSFRRDGAAAGRQQSAVVAADGLPFGVVGA